MLGLEGGSSHEDLLKLAQAGQSADSDHGDPGDLVRTGSSTKHRQGLGDAELLDQGMLRPIKIMLRTPKQC